MGKRSYKRYRTKYKKITIEELFAQFQCFCLSYAWLYILTFVLGLLSKVNDNMFFQWCGIISTFLSIPMSQSDFLILVFGLHWLVFSLGIVFSVYKVYKTFSFDI